jgi:AcrR family transcriptional regulator
MASRMAPVPKLWEASVDAHRDAVREAVLDAAWQLAAERGIRGVTMSQVAAEAGVGRATLYRYYPDVEAILTAAHERHVEHHLAHLTTLAASAGAATGDALARLEAVLGAFATICFERGRGGEVLGALVHTAAATRGAEDRVVALVTDMVAEAAQAGAVDAQTPPVELARFAVHALMAASEAADEAGVERVVRSCLRGLGAQPSA